jgi:hypothetical protein
MSDGQSRKKPFSNEIHFPGFDASFVPNEEMQYTQMSHATQSGAVERN